MTTAATALDDALRLEAEAQRRLLAGDAAGGAERMRAAAERYRESWAAAGPRSFGRLIGMLKATVIGGGDATAAARYARAEIGEPDSPASWYAVAIAALIEGDDATAARAAAEMRPGADAFTRTADAIAALATGDADRYATAVRAIVADFESRDRHLTGVPFADTALVLERLAEPRGLAAHPRSALLPA